MEYRYIKCEEFRLEGGDNGTPIKVSGYGAVFNSLSDPLPKKDGTGTFREVIRHGAFDRSLANNSDIRLLINHDGLPLARQKSGTLRCSVDQRGLRFEATLDPTDPDVQRVIPKMKRGDLNNCSFAFSTRKDAWRKEPEIGEVRELQDVDCSDVSLVTYPAYPDAQASLRSLGAAWESRSLWEKSIVEEAPKVEPCTPTEVLRLRLDLAVAD
jgi:hypothetical protein